MRLLGYFYDARPLGRARDTSLALGAVTFADRSAIVKIGCTTMLAAVEMEVVTPPKESLVEVEKLLGWPT